jgi:uncharacterized radical SAM superfamily Fe-S cluster-containing enzyme
VFERDEELKAQVFKLFSTNHSPESQASCLNDLLCCLPQVKAPTDIRYNNVFRVLIMQFQDAASFDVRAIKKSCVHIVQPDGSIIPFETFNLFYRDDRRQLLAEIRQELPAGRAPDVVHAIRAPRSVRRTLQTGTTVTDS